MPVRSYFLYIGSLLLALLFLADWYFPPLDPEQNHADVDRSTIRIHSAHKWPQAVVIDTTQPTIVPPPVKTVAAQPPAPKSAHGSAHDAYAMATEAAAAAPKPAEPVKTTKPHVRRTRTARVPDSYVAGPQMYGFGNDMFAPPRREAFASRNQPYGSRGFWNW
jgi:hypothetical protein